MRPVSSKELRDFGLLVGTLLGALFGLAGPLLKHHPIPLWPWVVGGAMAILALAAPQALRYPHLLWGKLGQALGWLNSRIVFNLLFFLIFVPCGVITRLTGWDPLRRGFDRNCPTYRSPSERLPPAAMEKPY